MNELYLSLAGIQIHVTAEAFGPMDFLKDYLAQSCLPEHSFRAELTERIDPPTGEKICDQPAFRVYRDGDCLLRDVGEKNGAYLRAIRQGRDGILSFRRDKLPQGITGKQLLNAMDLPHLLTVHSGFLLHASYIEWQGRAILFTAPSETGKSTQARLWCDYGGASWACPSAAISS